MILLQDRIPRWSRGGRARPCRWRQSSTPSSSKRQHTLHQGNRMLWSVQSMAWYSYKNSQNRITRRGKKTVLWTQFYELQNILMDKNTLIDSKRATNSWVNMCDNYERQGADFRQGFPAFKKRKHATDNILRSNSRQIPVQFSSSAAECVAQGQGLDRPMVGRHNSFTVDCSRAGNNVLFVGIHGPETPCEEVHVR